MAHMILSRTFTDVITYDEAAAHLRVWDEEDRLYIESLIEASLVTAESYMNRLITESTVLVTLGDLEQQLPLGRAKEVTELTYRLNGQKFTVPTECYEFDILRNRIRLHQGFKLPLGATEYEATITTGWAASEVPANVKHALLMLVATLYEMREDATIGVGVTLIKVPITHQYLLNKHKIYPV